MVQRLLVRVHLVDALFEGVFFVGELVHLVERKHFLDFLFLVLDVLHGPFVEVHLVTLRA